ncbi:MAG: bacillithiol biosynthesis cysteine-adding enzyme BshC [Rhodothermaceae bacterium]
MFINFSDIAGHQNIFLDYMYEFENVKEFYKSDFRNKDIYPEVFSNVATKNDSHRKKIVEIIKNQYKSFKYSRQTELNIESFKLSKTIAIVTGQQLGLMGGPLYTFYKIITTIKLCSFLKGKYDEYNFVPVFWLEGDDHDFDEISSINTIDIANDFLNINYSDGAEEDTNRGSVGYLKFNQGINDFKEELLNTLRDNEFKEDLEKVINILLKEDKLVKTSFTELLFNLFDEYGLVIFDPQDIEVKKMLKPVFKKEIQYYRSHTNIAVARSAALEELYHAQVKVKPVNLFFSDNTGRYLIEPINDKFRLKGKRTRWSENELLQMLEENPQSFSSNVILRPICQDFLFPTGVYVGGPGEISYFAQVIPFYNEFELPQPILYPRASATIVEKNIHNIMDKYELGYSDFFIGDKFLTGKMISMLSEVDLEKTFGKTETDLELIIDELKTAAFTIDPTLKDTVEKSKQRIQQTLDTIKNKTEKAQERKHDLTLRQVKKAQNLLFPEDALQERKLNFIYFANKYGINILKWIFNELAINKFEHQIIEL